MKKHIWFSAAAACIAALAIMSAGCSKDTPLSASGSNANVNMNVSFSTSTQASALGKTYGSLSDSLRIDSAVVVLARIKFESHLDSVEVVPIDDGMGGGGMMDHDSIDNYSFKGPFVVHVRDTVSINFANAELPAGTYDGIKFRIHNLMRGELREDSDMRNHRPWFMPDSSIAGSSLTVWGAIKKNGAWVPFKYNFNGEVEFKVRGTFVVPEAGSNVSVALNFNIASFFIDRKTGALLDPTDTSLLNRIAIRQAVYAAFGGGRCGLDRGDGRPR